MNNEIHSSLVRYFNTCCLSKRDFTLSLIAPQWPLKKNAALIKSMYTTPVQIDVKNNSTRRVEFTMYQGHQPAVKKIQQLFSSEISDDLIGAYLHGSLASNEEISYSDFDGILIIKDEVFYQKSRLIQVAKSIQKSIRIIHDFDPLQHHGWFIITEKMLNDFPEHYFPSSLFNSSVSLLENRGTQLTFQTNPDNFEATKQFHTHTSQLISKLTHGGIPKNMFYLKSLLSEFMLMPVLFLHANSGNEVSKKDSFTEAKHHFEGNHWEIMDRVSAIRLQWHYNISGFQKARLSSNSAATRKLARKIAPKIPQDIAAQLTPQFFEEMKAFVQLCVQKVNQQA